MQGIQLYPAPHAVGVYPQFYNHQTTVALKIREKALSLTGGDFDIVDATSQAPVFKVSGKHFSLHGRKEFRDMQGNPLFMVKSESFHLHPTFVGKRLDSEEEIFRVKGKIWTLHDEMTATFKNAATGHDEEFVIRGDWRDRKAEIRLGKEGPVIATLSRDKWTARDLILDVQEYFVYVAPGVDLSLIAALCVCLDDLNEAQKSS